MKYKLVWKTWDGKDGTVEGIFDSEQEAEDKRKEILSWGLCTGLILEIEPNREDVKKVVELIKDLAQAKGKKAFLKREIQQLEDQLRLKETELFELEGEN